MVFGFGIRRSFFFLRLLVAFCIAALAVSLVLFALRSYSTALWLERADGFAVDVGALNGALARERGQTALMLSEAAGSSDEHRRHLDALRLKTDVARAAVAGAARRMAEESLGSGMRPASQRSAEASERFLALRGEVDRYLAGKGTVVAADWRARVTELIEANTELRRAAWRPASDGDAALRETFGDRETAYETAEAAGRERALVAEVLGQGRALNANELTELGQLAGLVKDGLRKLELRSLTRRDDALLGAVRAVQATYVERLGPIKRSLIQRAGGGSAAQPSGADTPLPSGEAWFKEASIVVDQLLALASSISLRAANERQVVATGAATTLGLVALLVLLAASGLLTAARFIGRRILQPLTHLGESARRMGQGDLSQPLVKERDDEFGEVTQTLEQMRVALLANQREQASLIEKLTQAKASLIHSERMLATAQLASGVGHEINNPLAIVLGSGRPALEDTEALVRAVALVQAGLPSVSSAESVAALHAQFQAALPPQEGREAVEALREVLTAGERAASIVARLRAFADARKTSAFAVDLVAEARLALSMVQMSSKGAVGFVDACAGEVRVLCEGGALRQVFLALLTNAVQAAAPEGTVTLRAGGDADFGWVEVTDDGPGIDDAVLPRVFEPFFTTRGIGGGTGMGLTLSHGVVSANGGRIEVASIPGQGARFRVVLPRAKDAEARPG